MRFVCDVQQRRKESFFRHLDCDDDDGVVGDPMGTREERREETSSPEHQDVGGGAKVKKLTKERHQSGRYSTQRGSNRVGNITFTCGEAGVHKTPFFGSVLSVHLTFYP